VKQSINIPKPVSKDDAITAKWANSLRRSVRNLANGQADNTQTRPYRKTLPPFYVYLDAQADYSYKVRVTTGRVIEKLAEDENPPILLHEPSNITATESIDEERKVAGLPLEFDVTEDQYVCVTCYVLQDGSIGVDETENPGQEPVTVTIRDDYEATLPVYNYDPNYGNTGIIHYPLARVVLDQTTGEFDEYSILKLEPMMMGSHIQHIYSASTDADHMWKVTEGLFNDPVQGYNVKGGFLTVQGTTVTVDDAIELAGVATGFVYLKVARDSTSRAYDSHAIEWHTTAQTSQDYEEFYLLASVVSGVITQHRYEEIISQELMIVALGEFKLAPMVGLTRNTYSPP